MKKEILGKCPVCGKDTVITEVSCSSCETSIRSKFDTCKFCKLNENHRYFIEIFVKNRGSIKDVEKELQVSYPTVRRLLDDAIEALGYKPDRGTKVDRGDVLDRLGKGEITSEEALKLLNSED